MHKLVENDKKLGRGNLLATVTQCTIGIAVRLNHQSVDIEVHSLLGEQRQQFALARNVTGVAQHWNVRNTPFEFERYLPLRGVAENLLAIRGEAPVYHSQLLDACIVETLKCTYPQFKVGIHWIFHKNWNIHPTQGIGNILHCKRVCGCTCTHPQNIDTSLETLFNVLRGSNLRCHRKRQLATHAAQPR